MKPAQYDTAAKFFHWLIVALMLLQFPLGWLMPNIRRGMTPGLAMNLHISIGLLILAIVLLRLGWRLARPVAADPTVPAWQSRAAEALHWALYALSFAVTLSGWFYAPMRGWSITLFGMVPVPALVSEGSAIGRALGRLHENLAWVLIIATGLHVAAALAHHFIFRDTVLQRMLPRRSG
jgi:cytochrome b561